MYTDMNLVEVAVCQIGERGLTVELEAWVYLDVDDGTDDLQHTAVLHGRIRGLRGKHPAL